MAWWKYLVICQWQNRLLAQTLGSCYTFAAPYIDDIIVFSEDGMKHVRCVFEALQQHGLTVKEAKCAFGRSQIEYLGHVIGNGVLAVPPIGQRVWPTLFSLGRRSS